MGELSAEAAAFLAVATPPRPWPSLTPGEARQQNLAARRPDLGAPDVATLERSIARRDGSRLQLRVYSPFDDRPVLVFFHGGGWVYGDLDMADGFCRRLAHQAQVTVCSVDYCLAPEHPFPEPLDDAVLSIVWASEHLASGESVGVIGSSAGGNLAAAATLACARGGASPVALQVLLCPVTDCSFDTSSYAEHGVGKFLETADMRWYWDQYHPLVAGAEPDPLAAVLRADASLLAGAAPALMITAEHDVLRDEGEAYAARLAAAGVEVAVHRHDGLIHAFAVLSAFPDAQTLVIAQTKAAVDRYLRQGPA